MPLGEFSARAKLFGYTKQTILIPGLRVKLVYRRRGKGETAKLVEVPSVAESLHLEREVALSLCVTAGIPPEDSGLGKEWNGERVKAISVEGVSSAAGELKLRNWYGIVSAWPPGRRSPSRGSRPVRAEPPSLRRSHTSGAAVMRPGE